MHIHNIYVCTNTYMYCMLWKSYTICIGIDEGDMHIVYIYYTDIIIIIYILYVYHYIITRNGPYSS